MASITVPFPEAEHAKLVKLAQRADVSLADALRHGASLYLAALLAPKTRMGRPPKTP